MQNPEQTYYKGGDYQAIQTQMKPINDLLTSGQYKDVGKDVIPSYYNGSKSLEETVAAIKGTPVFNPTAGPQVDTGSGPKPFTPGTPGSGFNAPGQGFFTPDILSNQAKAIGDYLKGISTNVEAPAAPSRNTGAPTPDGTDTTTPTPPTTSGTGTATTPTTPTQPTTISQFLDSLRKGTPPAVPNLSSEYQGFQSQSGFTQAQNDLVSANANLTTLQNKIAADKDTIKSTAGLTKAYINGELVSVDAQTADALRQAQAQVSGAQDRMQMAQTTLNTLVSLGEKDYENASQYYKDNFSQNLQLFTAISNSQNTQQDNARASIKTITDGLKGQPYDPAKITQEVKAGWQQLDLQAGQPVGTTEAIIKAQAGSGLEYAFHTTDNGQTTVFYKDSSGKIIPAQAITTGPPVDKPLTVAQKAQMTGLADNELKKGLDPKTGFINGADYVRLRSDWSAYQDVLTFDSNFGHLLSPNDKIKYGVK